MRLRTSDTSLAHVKGAPPDTHPAGGPGAARQLAGASVSSPVHGDAQRGFTMVELVAMMVIMGVLAAIVIPRFFERNVFDSRGFYDQVISTLRYAQKAAIAQRRFVCVSFPANNSVTLTQGTTNTCGGALASPSGTSYPLTSSHASFSGGAPAAFNFDALGRPSAASVITVNGYAASITVEAETGYVH